MNNTKRILIIKPDSIGELILFSGVLEGCARHFEGYAIDLVCSVSAKDVADSIPFLSRVITVSRSKMFAKAHPLYTLLKLLQLRFFVYDKVIYPSYSRTEVGDLIARYAKSRKKVAFDGDRSLDPSGKRFSRNKFFTSIIEGDKSAKSEIERNLEFLKKIGGDPKADDAHTKMWFLKDDWKAGEDVQRECGISEKDYITIFPGSCHKARRWPADKWSSLISQLAGNFQELRIVLMGTTEDRDIVDSLRSMLPKPLNDEVVDLCGKIPIRIAARVVADSCLAIATETSAIHIAAALGTPNVCIIGGGQFGRFYPYGDLSKNKVVCAKMDCYNCDWNCVYDATKCITNIEVSSVFNAARQLLLTKS